MSKIKNNKKEIYLKGISHVLLNSLAVSIFISAILCSGVEIEKASMINLIIFFIPLFIITFGLFYIGIESIISSLFKKKK